MTDNVSAAVVVSLSAEAAYPSAESNWIKIAPRGRVKTRDGRSFSFDPEALAARFNADETNIPIDFNHGSEIAKKTGQRNDAIGWIEEMEARPDGLYARVEWLEAGRAALAAKAYRYVSPAFSHNEKGNARWIASVALVTSPALAKMPALAQADSQNDMSPEAFMAKLRAMLALPGDADYASVTAAIETLQVATETSRAASESVQRLMTDLRTARGEAKSLRVADKIEKVMKKGVFPPYMRDWATALCSSDEAAFDRFVSDQGTPHAYLFSSAITPEQEAEVRRQQTRTTNPDDAARLAHQLGIDPKIFEGK